MGPSSSSSEDMQIGKFKSILAAAEASISMGGVRLHEERWCFCFGKWDLGPPSLGIRPYHFSILPTNVFGYQGTSNSVLKKIRNTNPHTNEHISRSHRTRNRKVNTRDGSERLSFFRVTNKLSLLSFGFRSVSVGVLSTQLPKLKI